MGMCKHNQEFETCRFGCTLKDAEVLRLENDALHKLSRRLEAELTSAKDDVADFNRGWKWAQNGKELSTQEDNCLFKQGWQVFMFDGLQSKLAELANCVIIATDGAESCDDIGVLRQYMIAMRKKANDIKKP
jgi:hypothetical protein